MVVVEAASAYFCGSATQTNRSTSSSTRSTSTWCARPRESMVGQVEQDQAVEGADRGPPPSRRRGAGHRRRASRAAHPPRRRPRCPRSWVEVVGRRTPTAARSAPMSALNVRGLAGPGGARERHDGVAAGRWRCARRPPCRRRLGPAAPRRAGSAASPASTAAPSEVAAAARRSGDHDRRPGRRPSGAGSSRDRRRAGEPAGLQAGGLVLRRGLGGEGGQEPSPLLPVHLVDHLEQALTGLGRHAADGLVAEDRLEQLLRRAPRVPPAIPTSAPMRPPVWANTTTMRNDGEPVDAERQEPGVGAAALRPRSRTRSNTSRCQSRTSRSTAAVDSGRPGSRPASSTSSTGGAHRWSRHQARTVSDVAASRLSSISASTPVCSASPRVSTGAGAALDGGRHAVAPPGDSGLHLSGSSSPVPTNSCQRASTSPRSRVPSADAVVDARRGPRRRPGRRRRDARRPRRPARPARVGEVVGAVARGCAPPRRGSASRRRSRASASPASTSSQPRSLAHGAGRAAARLVERALGDGEQRRVVGRPRW